MILLWLGRFDEAERWLEQARRAVRPDGDPGTELMVHHSMGLLSMARGHFDEAFAAFEAAERMQTLLAGEHAFSGERRSRIVQMHAWRGELVRGARGARRDGRRGARPRRGAHRRGRRPPRRGLAGAGGRRARAGDRAPGTVAQGDWAAIDASLLDALARDQLGDRRGAEASIERALELAEPEGVILPFILFPVRELLERHPRHRTAHATLLTEILDVLAGASARPAARRRRRARSSAKPSCASSGTCRATSRRRRSRRSSRLVEHGADAPAPHLRQARRAQPHGGGRPRPRARPARTRPRRALSATAATAGAARRRPAAFRLAGRRR